MFNVQLPIRIDDINYGNHLGHDKLITLMHEARLQFFAELGQSELNFYGAGLILKSLKVNYQKEVFYPDNLQFDLSVSHLRTMAFTINYLIKNQHNEIIANADIVLVAYDYQQRKAVKLSTACKKALLEYIVDKE